jgi:hypothetical protein
MATTHTASLETAQPRLYHGGVTAARAQWTAGETISASAIVQMIKIPNHCWVLDGYVTGVSGAADTVWKVGVVAESDCSAAITLSSTASAHRRFNAVGLPFKVSLSDSANPQYTWLYLTHSTGSVTTTHSLQVCVFYAATGAVS